MVLLIFFHYLGWLTAVESGLRKILMPIPTAFNNIRISISNAQNNSKDKQDLIDLYNTCLANGQKNAVDGARLLTLEQENATLQKQLNFFNSHKYTMVSSNVIGKNDSLENMIMIDAGQSANIKVGEPVIVGEGILVGTIANVQKDVSMVRLISDNQSKIAATILNKDKSLGIVEGGYGLSIKMNFIPRDEAVIVGNTIITSGLEENIPRGLLIGEVAAAENEAYQPFQQAILTPIVDLSKLTEVSVITSNQ